MSRQLDKLDSPLFFCMDELRFIKFSLINDI